MELISGTTTLMVLREQLIDKNSCLCKKLAIVKDNHYKSIVDKISVMDFFILFVIGDKFNSEYGTSLCKAYYEIKGSQNLNTATEQLKQQSGSFLGDKYDKLHSRITDEHLAIFKNYTENRTLNDYLSLKNDLNLNDDQMQDLEKVYNYFILNNNDITLGDLRSYIQNDIENKFTEWAYGKVADNNQYFVDDNGKVKQINEYNNDELNAFMLFMAIVLKGAATPDSIREGEYSGSKPNIKFLAGCKKRNKWSNDNDYIWHRIANAFLGFKDNTNSFTNIDETNDNPLGPNRHMLRAKNDKTKLNNILLAIDGNADAIKNLGFDVKGFFNKNSEYFNNNKEITKKVELIKDQCIDLMNHLGIEYEESAMSSNDNKSVMSIVENAIKDFNQVIFTGAPGTGKTHSVRMHVKKFGERSYKFVQFHPSYDYSDFIEGLRPVNLDRNSNENREAPTFVRMDGVFKKFCRKIVENNLKELGFKNDNDLDIDQDKYEKLHKLFFDLKKYIDSNKKSIDNDKKEEDYINDYLEKNKDDYQELLNINNFKNNFIKLYTKKFEEIITEDNNNKSDYYYFIVDEVNRADLSKVFGEIMFGLEESYRGIENRFDTQYMNLKTYEVDETTGKAKPMKFDCFAKGFFIPRNLKFIGTMNDIDRSVESFDFALRRRFHWIDIKANEVMLESLKSILNGKVNGSGINELSNKVINMNEVISGEIGKKLGLSEAYHIGPAYFKNYNGNNLQNIFDNNIESILKEYARGRRTEDIKNLINECRDKLLD